MDNSLCPFAGGCNPGREAPRRSLFHGTVYRHESHESPGLECAMGADAVRWVCSSRSMCRCPPSPELPGMQRSSKSQRPSGHTRDLDSGTRSQLRRLFCNILAREARLRLLPWTPQAILLRTREYGEGVSPAEDRCPVRDPDCCSTGRSVCQSGHPTQHDDDPSSGGDAWHTLSAEFESFRCACLVTEHCVYFGFSLVSQPLHMRINQSVPVLSRR